MARSEGELRGTTLVRLRDSDLVLEDPAEDVRGEGVLDKDGDEIGKVEELLVDEGQGKVRFLQVGAGGIFGLGERKFLIPVDAITAVHRDHVHVDQSRDKVVGAPAYDPETMPRQDYLDDVYAHYGYAPFWTAGYVYPGYPFYL